MAVGIATFDHQLYQKVCPCCCYYFLMADAIARMADGIAMFMIGRCCCHVADVFTTVLYFLFFVGRCYCLVADVFATIM